MQVLLELAKESSRLAILKALNSQPGDFREGSPQLRDGSQAAPGQVIGDSIDTRSG
nr:hypothetical protein [uncultured Sphingomonas sp.]